MECFFSNIGDKISICSHHFHLILYIKILASALKQEKEIKSIQVRKEYKVVFVYRLQNSLCIKNPWASQKRYMS